LLKEKLIMKVNIRNFVKESKVIEKKVKDMVSNGKNIYKNIKGHENEINYKVCDLPFKKTGLKNIVVSMTILYPGKVGKEFKMTTGHSHKSEEVYLFLKGKGFIILNKKKIKVKENDIISVPSNVWHRVVNTGKEKLVFLSIFQKYGERGK
jgi:glucose-6-phosphate isomerase